MRAQLLPVALLAGLASGCTFFTIDDVVLPQAKPTETTFEIPASADMTWSSVRAVSRRRPVKELLVRDDELRIASWTEEHATEGCGSGAKSKTATVALHTAWVSAADDASRLHLRKTCFPVPAGEIKRSNGAFELEFAKAVVQDLIDELKRR